MLFEHVGVARLTMRAFSDRFLDLYLDAVGSAATASVGAYQLEGLGIQLFERVDGDYFTVLGLPLLAALDFLRRHGCLAAMSDERPFILCLTGSLGMGKSTAAKFFAEAGVPVHDSDAVVHALYEGEAVAAIERRFPARPPAARSTASKLAAMVLNDKAALARLEAIVHPLVRRATGKIPGRRAGPRRKRRRARHSAAVRDRGGARVAMPSSWFRRRPRSSAGARSSGPA